MINLFVENTKLPSPVAAIRWCVDRGILEKLKEFGVTKPFLCLVIASEDRRGEFIEVNRKFIPLDQAMEYLEFRRPGKHRVFGLLVWLESPDNEQKRLKSSFSKSDIYINYQGVLVNNSVLAVHEIGHGSVDVIVPDGYFAPEPAKWEKFWVNLWYESEPKNQCHFRKRRLLAYSVQPPVVFLYVLFQVFIRSAHVLLLLLLGVRQINYRAVIHPFLYNRWDAAPKENIKSIFEFDSSGKSRHSLFILLMPIIQIVFLVIAFAIWFLVSKAGWHAGYLLYYFLGVNIVVALTVLLAMSDEVKVFFRNLFPQETDEERQARRRRELEELYSQYDDLTCTDAAMMVGVSALSPKRRTFYLRFKELKSKVCLPFAS